MHALRRFDPCLDAVTSLDKELFKYLNRQGKQRVHILTSRHLSLLILAVEIFPQTTGCEVRSEMPS